MAYYRLYFFGRAGHIERFAEIEAESDGEAIPAAGVHAGGAAYELWCGGRKVHASPAGEGQRAA